MVEQKVSCPQCRSDLRLNMRVPLGMKVKCPRCGILFDAPHPQINPPHAQGRAEAAAVWAGAAARQAAAPLTLPTASAPEITAAPPVAAPSRPAAVGPPATPTLARPPVNRGTMLALVVGGAGLLLVLAVVLVIFCFSGDERAPSAAPEGEDLLPGTWQAGLKKKPAPPPLIVLSPEEQKKVDAAVQKGVEFLKKQQLPNGRWPAFRNYQIAPTALAGLTLLEAGVRPSDPAVAKAAQQVRDSGPGLSLTYELSLVILFLDRLGDARDRELIQQLTVRLAGAQTAQGGWSYNCPVLSREDHELILGALKELKTRTPEELLRDPRSLASRLQPRRRLVVMQPDQARPANFYRGGGDNSNTQFAILALWAARKHDVPLDKTLALVSKRFRASQNSDGRWFYVGNGEVSSHLPGKGPLPTMTCAGLLGVAVGFGLQDAGKGAVRPDQDPVVQKGLRHLSNFIGQPGEHPRGTKPRMQELYFLWSAERVAVLYQLKTIEGKKWYEWGAEVLTTNQRPDGSWQGGGHTAAPVPVTDTCLALLFLQRVNLAKDLTDKLLELRALGPAAGPPPARKD
jgi:hypothetical protein